MTGWWFSSDHGKRASVRKRRKKLFAVNANERKIQLNNIVAKNLLRINVLIIGQNIIRNILCNWLFFSCLSDLISVCVTCSIFFSSSNIKIKKEIELLKKCLIMGEWGRLLQFTRIEICRKRRNFLFCAKFSS